MSAGGRRESRYEFLFNVTVAGGAELKKAGKNAQSAAAQWDDFAEQVDKTKVGLERGMEILKGFRKAVIDLEKAEDRLTTKMKEQKAIAANVSAAEAQTAALKEQTTAMEMHLATLTKGTKAYSDAQTRLQSLNLAHKESEKSLNSHRTKAEKMKKTISESISHMGKLIKKLDSNNVMNLKVDKSTGKLTGDMERLKTMYVDANVAIKHMNATLKGTSAKQKKAAKGTNATTDALNQQTKAVRRSGKEWDFWHDQRIGAGKSISLPGFRRSLGAIRNQLLVLAFATQGLRKVFNSAFEATRSMESALRGLNSVSLNTGGIFGEAAAAAQDLAKSGLLTVSEASAGLKNLLSAGFGLPQAIKLMDTFTDSAAFNRQGTLKLGQAVVGATQGVKNQNSIMVDNAGITKNLSIMYKEYAASIGTSSGKLTEAQKKQAIYNGILKEGSIFAGDSIKVLDTMEGSLAQLSVTIFNAAAALGDIMQPAISAFLGTVKETYSEIQVLLSDKTFKFEAMQKSEEEGRKAGEAFKALIDLMKGIKSAGDAMLGTMNSLKGLFKDNGSASAENAITNTTLVTSMLKIVVAQRLLGRMATKSIARTKMLNKELNNHVFASRNVAGSYKILNIATGKQIGGMKAIGIAYTKLIARSQHHIITMKKQQLEYAKTGAHLKVLGEKLKIAQFQMAAFGRSVKIAGGAMKVFAISVLAALKSLARLTSYLIAFEAIAWAISAVTDKLRANKKEISEHTRKTLEHIKQFTVLNDKYKEFADNIRASGKQADVNLFSKKALQKESEMLHRYLQALELNIRAFHHATTRAMRLKAEKAIQTTKEQYEKQRSIVASEMQKIQNKVTAFWENVNSMEATFLAHQTDERKRNGSTELIDKVNHYHKMVAELEKFHSIAFKLRKLDAQRAEEIEKNLLRGVEESRKDIVSVQDKLASDMKAKLESFTAQVEKKGVKAIMSPSEIAAKQAELWKNQMYTQLDTFEADMGGKLEKNLQTWRDYGEDAAKEMGKGMAATIKGLETNPLLTEAKKSTAKNRKESADPKKDVSLRSSMKAETGLVEQMDNIQKMDPTNVIAMSHSLEQMGKHLDVLRTMGPQQGNEEITAQWERWQHILGQLNGTYDEHISKVDKNNDRTKVTVADQASLTDGVKTLKGEVDKVAVALEGQTASTLKLREMERLRREDNQADRISEGIAKRWEVINQMEAQNALQRKIHQGYVGEADGLRGMLSILTGTVAVKAKQAQAELALNQSKATQIADRVREVASLQKEQEWYAQLASGKATYGDVTVEVGAKEMLQAELKVAAIQKQIEAHGGLDAALEGFHEKELARLEDERIYAAWQKRIAAFQQVVDFAAKMVNQENNLEHKRLEAERDFQLEMNKEVHDGSLLRQEADRLALAHSKLLMAEQKRDSEINAAIMKKDVTMAVLTAVAKSAAKSGNVPVALAAAAALGIASVAMNNYVNKKTEAANETYRSAQLDYHKAESGIRAEAAARMKEDEESADGPETMKTAARKISGTIKAESLNVTISPVISVSGEQIFIGSGSVMEFQSELHALLLQATQDAINNREIDLGTIQGGG
jgi:hypothetical protein